MSFLDSRQQVAPQGIGKPVRRREDARFLTGAGKYADDMNLPGQAYAYVVRSPHAHARIVRIDVGPATGGPGVLAVLTGSDAEQDRLQPIPHRPAPANPHEVLLRSRDGSPFFVAPHPILAFEKTRYVGEPVAVVIAETLWQAMDAAELLAVDYAPLPTVARSADALAPGAPFVWEEHGTNLCVDSETGDKAATELAFGQAAHVVWLETAINRVTGVPMELRAAVGAYDEAAARYTVYTSAGGGVVRQRDDIAAVLGVPAAAVRVVSGDVGGNFGIRNDTYPELALVAWAARRVGRPVKWSVRAPRRVRRRFPRPRPDIRGGARARRAWPFSRHPRGQHQQSGRQRDFLCPARQGDRRLLQRLRHSMLLHARPRGGHEHLPDFGLSQRRAPGGHVRPRAHD
jgi:aerobic carbon-monoxide dehydrogenase large subunit